MKKLSAFFYLLTLSLAIFCVACDFKLKSNEEVEASQQLHVHRYDRLQSRYLTTGDFSALQQMNTDFPVETRTLLEDMLQLGEVNDAQINARFLNFYQDSTLQAILADAEIQYADISDVEKLLDFSFSRLQKFIPTMPLPVIYAQIGALGQSIVVGDSLIGISLDKYLGADYPLYAQFYDEKQRATMTRKSIVPDCLVFWLLSHYPMPNFENATQQERDVHMGRIMWAANKAMNTLFFRSPYTTQAERYMIKHPNTDMEAFLMAE